MNLKAFFKASEMANGQRVHIVVLDFQFECANKMLQEITAVLYSIKLSGYCTKCSSACRSISHRK